MCLRALLSAGPDAHDDAFTTLTHTFQQRCSQFRLIRLKEDHPECGDDSTFRVFYPSQAKYVLSRIFGG